MAEKKDRKWMQKVLKSSNPKTKAKTKLTKAIKEYIKATGGEVSENTVDFLTNMKETFINSLSDASLMNLVKDIEEAYRKNQAYDRINMFAGELLTRRYGGSIKRYQEGGTMEPMMPEQPALQQQAPIQQQPQMAEGQPDITYEQYVQFIISYPEYLDRFLQDVEAAKQMLDQQGAEGQPVEQEQQMMGEEPAI
jgi:hypothetical protein